MISMFLFDKSMFNIPNTNSTLLNHMFNYYSVDFLIYIYICNSFLSK